MKSHIKLILVFIIWCVSLFGYTTVKADSAADNTSSQSDKKELVIMQVRDEVHLPVGSKSSRIEDYSTIVQDGWYRAEDNSFRVRIPHLGSGKINVVRRRWEKPDGVDVQFWDENDYWFAVFSAEPGHKPAAEKLKKKYTQYLESQSAKFEIDIIETQFGKTMQIVILNRISSRYFPYDPPQINTSKEKVEKVGITVGVSWTFWNNNTQYGVNIISPVDSKYDEAAIFNIAKKTIKDFAGGVELKKD